jgi:hypothetical protein
MLWNTIRSAALPAICAAGLLGTAVLAQQGGEPGAKPTREAAEANLSQGAGQEPKQAEPARRDLFEQKLIGQIQQLEDTTAQLRLSRQLSQTLREQSVEQKDEVIRRLLARKCDLRFPGGATLDQFLKAVRQTTSQQDYPGIPIYVSPEGLADSRETLDSRVIIKPEGSLAEEMQRALKRLHLSFTVSGGLVLIDSRMGIIESRLGHVEEKLDRILKGLEAKGPGR